VLKFAFTLTAVVPFVVPVALVRLNQVALVGLIVAAKAWAGFVVSLEVTLTCCVAGAAPFSVADTEIPLNGLASIPRTVIVPCMPAVPQHKLGGKEIGLTL
jgi:hypothetical protein